MGHLVSFFFIGTSAVALIVLLGSMIVLLLKILLCLFIFCYFKDQNALLWLHVIPQFIVSVVIELCKFSRAGTP